MKTLLQNPKILSTVFILFCLFLTDSTFAQVSTLQNWTSFYSGTSTATQSATYTVPVGTNTNRLLVVAISSTTRANSTKTVTLTYGGQTLTQANADITTSNRQNTAIYYLDEAGLDAASGSSLSARVQISSGNVVLSSVWAAVFDYVDQTSPIADSKNYNSASVQNPFVFGSNLNIDAGNQAVLIANSCRTGNTGFRNFNTYTDFTLVDSDNANYNAPGGGNQPADIGTNFGIFNYTTVPLTNTSSNCSITLSGTSLPSMTGVSIKGCSAPTVNVGSALSAICQGGTSAALGGSVGGSATGGTWSDGGVGGTFSPNATTLNATWTPPGAYSGTATLTLTSSGGSCGTATATKTIVVNPIPTAVTANASEATICIGSSIDLTASATSTTVNAISQTNSTVFAIPDNNTTGVTSTITVPATCATAAQVATVSVNITHTWNADLAIYLIAPDNSQIALSLNNGGNGDNYNATFQTGGATLPTGNSTISGTFNPQNAFSGLTGDASGSWGLKVVDNAGSDTGTINSWEITFASTTCPLTYAWTSTPSGFTSVLQNPTGVTPTATTTYTVTATNIFGCSASATTTVTINTSTSWTGGTSSVWTDASNWSCSVPTSTSNVTISTASFYPEITSNVTINSLTIDSGTTLKVVSGHNLTVTDVIANAGTLTVENDANLKQDNNVSNTGAGSTVVKRNTATLMRQDYVLWSSPVSGQQLQAFSPQTLSTRFYTFDGSAGAAGQYVAETATNSFSTGVGYLIRLPNNHPSTPTVWSGTFTGGNAHNGTITQSSLTSSQYYAIGNPYPSTIDAEEFIAGNSLEDAIYFWRKTNNSANTSYATYTLAGGVGNANSADPLGLEPDGTIAVGQGFIVKTGSTSLTFDNGMRTTNNASIFFRTTNENRSRIWLNLTNATGIFSQTMVAYMENATLGIDNMIDGRFLNDTPTAINSIINNEEFVIQGRSLPFETTDIVPLGFKTNAAGNYSIAIDHVDGLFDDESQLIFIKDNLLNTEHNLRTAPYTFTSEVGTFNTRFEVVYQSTLSVTNPSFENGVLVYSKNKAIEINSGLETMASVRVVDIRGSVVANLKDVNATSVSIPLTQIANQVLIVQITGVNGQTVTKKVVH